MYRLWSEVGGLRLAGAAPRWFSSLSFRLWLFKSSSTRAWDSPVLLARHDTPLCGRRDCSRGPVEHLADTRARTVLRVRRNVLGVLPIRRNTRASSIRSLPPQIRSMQPAHHPP